MSTAIHGQLTTLGVVLGGLVMNSSAPGEVGMAVPDKAMLASLIEVARLQSSSGPRCVELSRIVGDAAVPERSVQCVWVEGSHGVQYSEIRLADAATEGHPTRRSLHATDGATTLSLNLSGAGSAALSAADDPSAGLSEVAWNSQYHWLLRWLPAPAGSSHPLDLVALLQSDRTELRQSAEVVDGAPCAVLDVRSPEGVLVETIWLDAAHGWLPRLQRLYAIPDGTVDIERRVTAFVVAEGVPIPSEAVLTVADRSGAPAGGGGQVRLVRLLSALPDGWAVELCEAGTIQFEHAADLIPQGATVMDLRSGAFWTQGG